MMARAWRQRWLADGRRDPLTRFVGLLTLAITAWWLVPAFTGVRSSVIERVIDLSIRVGTVQVVLIALTTFLAVGKFGFAPAVARAAASAAFVWWGIVWILLVFNEPWSTAAGSYGLVLITSGTYAWRANRRVTAAPRRTSGERDEAAAAVARQEAHGLVALIDLTRGPRQ